MTLRNWDSQRSRQEISRLLTPGILGHYTNFEATEVFAAKGKGGVPFNVFFIFVAEELAADAAEKPHLLNHERRIKVKSLPDWNFGINRYVSPIAELVPLLDTLCDAKEWRGSGRPLHAGDLISAPPQFVPPDFSTPVPWNRVLKNNFWNGSHVLEWADAEKAALRPLFDDPRRLQELSEAVRVCTARLGQFFGPAREHRHTTSRHRPHRQICARCSDRETSRSARPGIRKRRRVRFARRAPCASMT
jgi:hypothetical protein